MYLTLFTKVSHYAIQVAHLNDEQKAINLVNRLKNDCFYRYPTLLPNRLKNPCWRKYKKKNNQKSCLERQKLSYCSNDNIYYQAILRSNKPHNGFSYNVFFGKYSKNEYTQARNDLLFIRKKYRLEKNIWINSINTIIEGK